MRAFFAALAQILRGLLGVMWAPFQWAGSLFSGRGGGSPQDDAALVAQHAANQEMTRDMELVADKPLTLDEASTVKRVCGRLLAGKPIAEGTRLSPSVLGALADLPRPLLKRLADADIYTVTDFIDGHRAGYLTETASRSGISPEQVQARFPKLAVRIAARTGEIGEAADLGWGARPA